MAADGVSETVNKSSPLAGVDVRHEASRVVVRLWGEHGLASTAMIADAFFDAVDNSDADVVVDLTAVEFMDCSTLRVLVSSRAMLAQRSRRLTVRVSPTAFAHRVLVLCGLGDMVERTSTAGQPRARSVATALESWVEVPCTTPVRPAGSDPQPDLLDDRSAEGTKPRTSSGPVASAGPRYVF